MKKLIPICILILIVQLGFSNIDTLFNQANSHYIKNELDSAIFKYEKIIEAGYQTPELYFNLGNSYFKINSIGKAILNYERAKLLDPKNEDIEFNLELANSYSVDKIDEIPEFFIKTGINNFAMKMHSNAWAIISIISFLICLILVLFYLFTKKLLVKKLTFWLAVILILVSISSFSFSRRSKNIITQHKKAIIMSPSITAKSTPDESGTDLFVIHEGTKANIEDKVGNWAEIKLSDGSKGWIPKKSIEYISLSNKL